MISFRTCPIVVEEERFGTEGRELGRRIRSWEAAALLSEMPLLGTQGFCVREGAALPKFPSQFTVPVCPALLLSLCELLSHLCLEKVTVQVNVGFFFVVHRGGLFLLWFVFLYSKTNINQRKAFCTGVLVLVIVLSLFCVL